MDSKFGGDMAVAFEEGQSSPRQLVLSEEPPGQTRQQGCRPRSHCMQSEEDVEEVFELELDWTPVNKDSGEAEPVPLKLTKEAQRERVSKKRNESGGSDDGNVALVSHRLFYSKGPVADVKGSPCESPPSKRVLLATADEVRPQSALRFGQGDAFYEYLAEAYAAKLAREDRYWFGCKAALALQPDLTPGMRKALLLWLIAVVKQFNFNLETWCITVSILDRFLMLQTIRRDCLQLAGLSAFFIAAKAEEVEPPEVWELVSLCANSYDRNQFLLMEFIMLTHLKFEILSPTAAFFLHHQVELETLTEWWPYELSAHLIELSLCDEWLSNIGPSFLATCIFNVIIENWCPKVFVDLDYIDQLMDIIRCTFLA